MARDYATEAARLGLSIARPIRYFLVESDGEASRYISLGDAARDYDGRTYDAVWDCGPESAMRCDEALEREIFDMRRDAREDEDHVRSEGGRGLFL